MGAVSSLFKGFDPSRFSASIGMLTGVHELFLILVVLFVFLYGLSVGKTRAILSLVAIYAAFVLTATFPFMTIVEGIPGIPSALTRAGVFLAFYVIVSLLLNFAALKNRLSMGELSFAKVLIVSIFQVGLLASALLFLVPREALPKQLAYVYPYFGTAIALFCWSLAGLAILPFLRHGRD